MMALPGLPNGPAEILKTSFLLCRPGGGKLERGGKRFLSLLSTQSKIEVNVLGKKNSNPGGQMI